LLLTVKVKEVDLIFNKLLLLDKDLTESLRQIFARCVSIFAECP
ncbi:12111_t:CDS:2, partial [Dentiscutata heterogama]